MKRIITLSIVALLFAGTAMAQDTTKKSGKEKNRKEWKKDGRHAQHMKHKGAAMKQLNLSDTQKEQFKSLNQDYKTKAKALKQERKAKADNILTAEQKAKMAQMKEERKAQAKQHAEQGFNRMKQQLNLTNDQGQQLKTLNETFRTKAKAIRENKSLTPEQKKEQFKALQEQHKQSMRSVLTAEQIQKMEAQKKNAKGQRPKKEKK